MDVEKQDTDGVKIQLERDEYTEVHINNVMIVIKHNDVGVSVDTYSTKNPELPAHKNEEQIWFDDFE